jgi:hypothetical protein
MQGHVRHVFNLHLNGRFLYKLVSYDLARVVCQIMPATSLNVILAVAYCVNRHPMTWRALSARPSDLAYIDVLPPPPFKSNPTEADVMQTEMAQDIKAGPFEPSA